MNLMKNTPKHTLIAGLAALLTATTILGAEPKPATTRAIHPTDPGRVFMMNAKIGIFVHYRSGQSDFAYGKPNPQPWDLDAHADAFDVKAFADAVEDMGAQYVIMTSFHASMNLLGPSKVMTDIGMPKHQSKRDMLGDLADELNKRNIALCLYVHPTDQHDLSQAERALFGWGPEVNGQPGPKLGLWPNPKWDAFLLGLFKEISQRYGKRVSGYWIDQHSGKLFPDAGRLAVALRSGNPDAVLWQNSGAYVPAGLSLEDAWCAPEGGQIAHGADDQHCLLPLKDWWYQSDEVTIPVEELFRAVARHNGCPGKKCGVDIGLTPYASGYAPKVRAMMAEFGKLWRERKVSLLDTRASTILKIEQKAVPWPMVATDSLDGSTVYVHVLIPPTGKSISLPALADGRKIISASLLLGGKEVLFKQSEKAVELSLPEDVKWDPVDTVIVLGMK